jgi:hypothetical protein
MCMADYTDGASIVLHDRNQKARKEHKCSECHRTIQIGETYNVQRAVFDGQADSYKTCAHCQVVQSWLQKECGGYVYQGVHEDINEHRLGGYGFGVVRLAAGMGAGWHRRDGRLWPIPKLPKITEHHKHH